MTYDWDARKARRYYLARIGIVLLATIVTAGLPIYIVTEAMSR